MNDELAVRTGFWLFIDFIVMGVGGWAFWLIVSTITTPNEIGYAITVISLIGLITGISGLGLDYALLREVSQGKGSTYGTAMAFQSLLLLAALPLLLLVGLSIYGISFAPYMMPGAMVLILFGPSFVSRSSALGLLESRKVLFYDTLGIVARIIAGVGLVILGLGGLGIVTAGLVQQALIAIGLTALCYGKIGFRLAGMGTLKNLLRLGLSNYPARISGLVTTSLSVVLLAAITGNPSSVGVFFMALVISWVAGGFATSLAIMAIPASANKNSDTTATTLRLGLCLTAPIVAALISSPRLVLSLLGEAYVLGHNTLAILATAVIPAIVIANAVAKLNHLKDLRRLILLGGIQLASLLALFFLLVEPFGATGAALAILTSSVITSIPSLRWLGKAALKPALISSTAVIAGWLVGSALAQTPQPISLLSALASSTAVIFIGRGVTPTELLHLVKTIRSQPPTQSS